MRGDGLYRVEFYDGTIDRSHHDPRCPGLWNGSRHTKEHGPSCLRAYERPHISPVTFERREDAIRAANHLLGTEGVYEVVVRDLNLVAVDSTDAVTEEDCMDEPEMCGPRYVKFAVVTHVWLEGAEHHEPERATCQFTRDLRRIVAFGGYLGRGDGQADALAKARREWV